MSPQMSPMLSRIENKALRTAIYRNIEEVLSQLPEAASERPSELVWQVAYTIHDLNKPLWAELEA